MSKGKKRERELEKKFFFSARSKGAFQIIQAISVCLLIYKLISLIIINTSIFNIDCRPITEKMLVDHSNIDRYKYKQFEIIQFIFIYFMHIDVVFGYKHVENCT